MEIHKSAARTAVTAGVLAAMVFATGCGSDDEESTASAAGGAAATTTSSSAPAASPAGSFYEQTKPGLIRAQTGAAQERAAKAGAAAAEAAGGKVEVPKGKTVGFAQQVGTVDTSVRARTVLQNAATAFGWKLQATDAGGDPKKIVSNLTGLLNQKVDAVVQTALPVPVVQQQLKTLTERGVPTVNVAAEMSPSPFLQAQYSFDLEDAEPQLIEEMAKDLPKGAKVAVIVVPALEAYGKIANYFKGEATKRGWDVVDTYQVDLGDLQNGTARVTNAALTTHPDLDAIWISNNPLPPIVAQLVQQRDKCGKVKLYGHIDEPANLEYMRRGCLTAVTHVPVEANSLTAFDQIVEKIARKKPVDSLAPDGAAAAKQYGLNVFKTSVLTKDNLPPEGSALFDPEDVYTFFKTKWETEFGVTLK